LLVIYHVFIYKIFTLHRAAMSHQKADEMVVVGQVVQNAASLDETPQVDTDVLVVHAAEQEHTQ